jgi:fatty acid synthase
VRIFISRANAATKDGCRELLNEALKLGKVCGIFNLAVSLCDAPFEEQTLESFEQSLAPKAVVTRHLDELSRESCPNLRYFVIFSSISCGRGNLSQSNYGMANSIMERIIERRHQNGLPAKAIQWGAIGNVGLLSSVLEKNIGLNVGGTLAQSIFSCFDVIDSLVVSKEPIVESMIIAKNNYGDGKKINFMETMLNILGIQDKKTLSVDTTLSKLGIDSLIAVEIQQVLERDYDLLFSAQELRSLTLRELEKRVLTKGCNTEKIKTSLVDIRTLMVSQFGDETTRDQIVLQVPSQSNDKNVKALIIPGFEGMANELTTSIAKQLNCQAYILQISKCFDATTLQEMLAVIWNDIIDLYSENEKFVIVGYSFGSFLGLKIANILESLDKEGCLIMIDGSPQFVKKLSSNLLLDADNDDEKLKQKVLVLSIKLMEPSITEQAIVEILQLKTFEEQYEKFKQVSKNQVAYSERFHRETSEALFNRSKISIETDENSLPILQRTPITLMKSQDGSIGGMSNDYGLGRYSTKKIEVHTIEGNHHSMLKSSRLVDLINNSVIALKEIKE